MQFITAPDPMLGILEWLCDQLMKVEITAKFGAGKHERTVSRSEYSAHSGSLPLNPVLSDHRVSVFSLTKIRLVKQ